MIDTCVDALGRRLLPGDLVALAESSDRAIGLVSVVQAGDVLVTRGNRRHRECHRGGDLVRLTPRHPAYATIRDPFGRAICDGSRVMCADGRRAVVVLAIGAQDPASFAEPRDAVVLLAFPNGGMAFRRAGGLRVVT